jgi:hypothetical protein
MSAPKTRLRKVACQQCGYTVRMARSWMKVGLPVCPCGARMLPESPADLAFCEIIGPEDVSSSDWTAICRENGWDDAIIRRGGAQLAYDRKLRDAGGILGRRAGAAHCVFAGCGRWVADDVDRCTAGHAQHEHAAALEAMPF